MPRAVPNRKMPDVVGLSEAEAEAKLTAAGFAVRVTKIDGKALMVTRDWNPKRAKLELEKGIVIGVTGG